MRIADLPPFLRIDQARELTQIGRTQLYEQARRFVDTGGKEGIPAVRFGRSVRIQTAALLALAGLDSTGCLPAVGPVRCRDLLGRSKMAPPGSGRRRGGGASACREDHPHIMQ